MPFDYNLKPEYIQLDSHKGIDIDYNYYSKNKKNCEPNGEWHHNRCIPKETKCENIKNKLLCNNITNTVLPGKYPKERKCLWESTSENAGYCYNKLLEETKIDNMQGNITGSVRGNDKFDFVTDLFFDEAIRDSEKKRIFDELSVTQKQKIQLAIDVKARKLGEKITNPSTTTA